MEVLYMAKLRNKTLQRKQSKVTEKKQKDSSVLQEDMRQRMQDKDYAAAIAELSKLAAPIDGFFDSVMVMDKDEAVKNNRLALLKAVDGLISKVADFSKIVLA